MLLMFRVYDEGRRAFRDGESMGDNPYLPGDADDEILADCWQDGYDDAIASGSTQNGGGESVR